MNGTFRPAVAPNVQNSILAHLVGLLDGIADHQRALRSRSSARRKDSTATDGILHRSSPIDLGAQ
jgi:ribonuclease P/MRP protein subunit POP3